MAKKKRVKSDKPILKITGWSEYDKRLRETGDLQLKIKTCEDAAKVKIDEAKAELQEAVTPLQSEIDKLVRSMEAFAVNHMEYFGRKRSRKLAHGTTGWRKSSSISVKKTTVELIKQVFSRAKAKLYIHTKETPDKEAMAKLTDGQLASVGARRKNKDDFFAEPDIPQAVDYEPGKRNK